MTSDAQRRALRNYYMRTKELSRVFMFKFNRERDADVIGKIEEQPNKSDYIRKLVRKDI